MPEIGEIISHYRITERLGAGGMGEVYSALDTTLNRMVAIKFLPPILSADPELLRRFEMEARQAASLNHPGVVGIHEFGTASGVHYAVMELIEGQTLRAALQEGPFPARKLLAVAVQVADGLAAAHAAGVVHRDLKPENIMLTDDGRAKILDFGLAKNTGDMRSAAEDETLALLTQPGALLGTAPYMSPEQARGEPVSCRSDLFSFGIVMYEMASGKNPFQRVSLPETLASIIREEAPALDADVPVPLKWTIDRCLAKDPRERYESTRDLYHELRCLQEHVSQKHPVEDVGVIATGRRAGILRRTSLWAAIFCVGLLIGGWLMSMLVSDASNSSISDVIQLTKEAGIESSPSIAPDGKSFIYAAQRSGKWDIYLQRVGGRNATNLTRDINGDSIQPAFSPDGDRIAFSSSANGGGIFVMGATGESARRISETGAHPAWTPDGKSLVACTQSVATPLRRVFGAKLVVISLATGQKKALDVPDAVEPNVSPHGYRIAFWGVQKGGQRDLWTISMTGGQATAVTDDAALDWHPVWSPDGQFLYFCSDRGGTMNLWRIRIDERSGRTRGQPQPVTMPSTYAGLFSLSRDGKSIAYEQVQEAANIEKVAFDPVSAQFVGQPVPVTSGAYSYFAPSVSPDGDWVAADDLGRQEDLVLMRSDGSSPLQLTDDPAKHRSPTWSPDSRQIAFHSDRNGRYEIWSMMADGSALRQITHSTVQAIRNPSWSPDGDWIAYTGAGLKSYFVAARSGLPRRLPDEIDGINVLDWSPNGKTLAGFSDVSHVSLYSLETGKVRRFDVESVSYPKWLPDSRRLLFARGSQLMVLDSQTALTTQIASIAPDSYGLRLSMPTDGSVLYFTRQNRESNIWLVRLQ